GLAARREEGRLLLVGHDGFAAGAQHLLLHLLTRLRHAHGVEVEYLLLDGGTLVADYAAAAPGVVLGETERSGGHVEARAREWAARGFTAAIVNSAAAAWVIPLLRAAGIEAVLLVHELPALLAEKGLLAGARAGTAAARTVVFAATEVRDRFLAATSVTPADARVMPQGCYRRVAFCPRARREMRRQFAIGRATTMVLGMGYADLRKGFDLFLQAWQAARRRGEAVLFCWLGTVEPGMRTYLAREIAAAEATGSFCLPGYQSDIGPWLSAADVFALTSREDPYPSVVLEALTAGLPVVAFAGTGGIPDLLATFGGGASVPLADADAMAGALLRFGTRGVHGGRARLAARARAAFSFADYTAGLLRLARPELAAVSVVVPSYNYARFLPERLASIFTQTYPVGEVVLLDDASSDDSLPVAAAVAAEWRRELRISTATVNSGSVFRQWRRAAEVAHGEFLWIAEADDAAEPELLASLVGVMQAQPGIDLAFCDSRAIDAEGTELWPSYRDYYIGAGAAALAQDGVFDGPDFARRCLAERNLILNASSVLWRRSALLAALERCGEELECFRIAGDWRLYLE
ncbi:MAG: glycosyltransferase, partial [Alphaproteobacteria bacterium]|nr:glycosyltransferase [Alphaproteobacteria bacterium]